MSKHMSKHMSTHVSEHTSLDTLVSGNTMAFSVLGNQARPAIVPCGSSAAVGPGFRADPPPVNPAGWAKFAGKVTADIVMAHIVVAVPIQAITI